MRGGELTRYPPNRDELDAVESGYPDIRSVDAILGSRRP